MADLKSGREKERKNKNDGRECGNSHGHLKPVDPEGSQQLHSQKGSLNMKEQRSPLSWTHAQSQDLGSHPLMQTLMSIQEETESRSKKSCSTPKTGQLRVPLKGKCLGMRRGCSALCVVRSQKEQMVKFFVNSQHCSHRKGSHSTAS